MRHRKAVVKLNRTSSHRSAMFRNMVTSLFKHQRICTTDVKAKALRCWGDHLISLAKRGDLHARRQAMAIVHDETVVKTLFDEAKTKYGAVSGGYTRLAKVGRRPGDAAPMTIVELIGVEKTPKKKKKKPQTKPVGEAQASPEPKVPAAPEQKAATQAPETKAPEVEPPLVAAETAVPRVEAAAAEETAQTESRAAIEGDKPRTL
jgi:large subunit ribosomal protein L17